MCARIQYDPCVRAGFICECTNYHTINFCRSDYPLIMSPTIVCWRWCWLSFNWPAEDGWKLWISYTTMLMMKWRRSISRSCPTPLSGGAPFAGFYPAGQFPILNFLLKWVGWFVQIQPGGGLGWVTHPLLHFSFRGRWSNRWHQMGWQGGDPNLNIEVFRSEIFNLTCFINLWTKIENFMQFICARF